MHAFSASVAFVYDRIQCHSAEEQEKFERSYIADFVTFKDRQEDIEAWVAKQHKKPLWQTVLIIAVILISVS